VKVIKTKHPGSSQLKQTHRN